MKTTKVQNGINFGLNSNTHKKIAQKLIKEEYPKLRNYAPIIQNAVVKPDFEEIGFHCNTHFYYPDQNMFRPRESFFDFDGQHNARSKFNEHMNNFMEASKYCRFSEMADEAGRAKHFLDDMSVGLHVQRGNILQKWRDKKMHERFEIYIRDNDDAFIKNAEKSPVEFKTDTFDDIFMSVANFTKDTEFPNSTNTDKWPEIAQNTINVAMDASRVFFDKVSKFMPSSRRIIAIIRAFPQE